MTEAGMRFRDKIALVTGGSRGIGRAIARKLALEGADVVLTFVKNESAAADAVAEIEGLGRKALALQADAGKPEEIRRIFEMCEAEFGRLDIFISNAVSGVVGPTIRIGKFGWGRAMDVNARAFLLGAQQAAGLMEKSGGAIVALSSIGSHRCLPGYGAVGASKAAVECLTRYLGVELAPKKIRVNAVSGGPVDTEALNYFPDTDRLKRKWQEATPAGRIADPDDIADVVLFLCSDESRWICGQTIVADGGLSLV
jgi:enoyl-[acyl-carrier protein] reductase III